MSLLLIARHGQTDDNTLRKLTGQNDVPLNVIGEEQARAMGEPLKGISLQAVFASIASRARNTASLALETAGQNITVIQSAAILEGNAGEWAGRNIETDPDVINFLTIYDFAPPGGESDKDLVARVRKFYEEEILPRLARGENLLVVCHSGTIRAFDIVLGLEEEPTVSGASRGKRRKVPNAGLTVHEFEEGKHVKSYDIKNSVTEHTPPPKSFKPSGQTP